MAFKVSDENRKKGKLIAVTVGMLLSFFVLFRYIVPLAWPVIVSFSLAIIIYPLVCYLYRRFRINKMVGTLIILVLVVGLVGSVCVFVVRNVGKQVVRFLRNIEYYQNYLQQVTDSMCENMEEMLNLEKGYLGERLADGVNTGMMRIQENMMESVVGNSIPALKILIDGLVATAVIAVVLILSVKDMDSIRKKAKECLFQKEIAFFYKRISVVVKAYVKAQLVIMTIVAAVTVLGLSIVGNPYSWLLGMLVGVLDALPLLGSGLILIPITIFYMIKQEMIRAAIVFTAFMVCYFLREFLEPKLMGEKVGVNSIVMLLGIYIGYQLFGFFGMFAGAFVVILLTDVWKEMDTSI